MKVMVYPADRYGCGHHRLIWPVEALRAQGHDVEVIEPQSRRLFLSLDGDRVVDVETPEGVDVMVLQRVTHLNLAQAIEVMRAKGITVVVDVDDDLSTIHPLNPAWRELHPSRAKQTAHHADPHMHSWANLDAACRAASLVTATTPALLRRYALHGRGYLLPNYLASHYYDVPRVDMTSIGWPASYASHPNDPDAVGSAIARLVGEGARFHVTSISPGVGKAFGLASDDLLTQLRVSIDLLDWPRVLAEQIGIAIVPLADTKFNAAKSWLKPLELSAIGVPWVASPRVEYKRLHNMGAGVLAGKPNDWYKLLRALQRSVTWRAELVDAGRAVAEQLRIEQHAWKWWEAWDVALRTQRRHASQLQGQA